MTVSVGSMYRSVPRSLHPDFMILHPGRGLLILEIKDWKLESINQVTKTSVTLLTADGLKETQNPMEQARTYAHAAVGCLEKDPALVGQPNNGYRGKLIFPWGYGVVFTNITRKAFDSTDLGEAFQPHQVICQDEMTESVDDEEFQERLWRMFNHSFGSALTGSQIDRIRWHLFPEIRIDPKQLSLLEGTGTSTQESSAIPNLLRVWICSRSNSHAASEKVIVSFMEWPARVRLLSLVIAVCILPTRTPGQYSFYVSMYRLLPGSNK